MPSLKQERNGSMILFYVEHGGNKVHILKGRLETANDIPRLYKIAYNQLLELFNYMKLAA